LKSGRPTGFLDASEALRVYHWAGTVNPDPRLVADERRPSVSPWRLGGLSAAMLARRVYDGVWAHDLLDRAASLSYYFLFALFPALLFLTALLGLLPGPRLMEHLLGYIAGVLPADAASLLAKTVAEVIKGARGSLASLGVLGALWGASSGMVSISHALNAAFDVRDTRTWWRHRLEAIGLTVWFSALTIVALLLFVFGERIGDAVAQWLGVGAAFTRTWNIARWPALTLCALVGIMLVYQLAPAARQHWRRITPGATFALAGWLLASYALRLYVTYLGNYNATYGSIGGVILLMLWFYLSSLALLVGAEINSQIHRAETQTSPAGGPDMAPTPRNTRRVPAKPWPSSTSR
jgi:membrane protein